MSCIRTLSGWLLICTLLFSFSQIFVFLLGLALGSYFLAQCITTLICVLAAICFIRRNPKMNSKPRTPRK